MRTRAPLALALLLLASCRIVPLVEPKPVSTTLAPEQKQLAIHRALAREGFDVREDAPSRIRAQLHRRDWTIVVDVTYAQEIEIHYVGSQSLDYDTRHGVPYIHRGYNTHVQRLADSIQREATLILADVDPDAFLGHPVSAPPPESPGSH
jgi:hypothetical protein